MCCHPHGRTSAGRNRHHDYTTLQDTGYVDVADNPHRTPGFAQHAEKRLVHCADIDQRQTTFRRRPGSRLIHRIGLAGSRYGTPGFAAHHALSAKRIERAANLQRQRMNCTASIATASWPMRRTHRDNAWCRDVESRTSSPNPCRLTSTWSQIRNQAFRFVRRVPATILNPAMPQELTPNR